jgi:hypothetical protein
MLAGLISQLSEQVGRLSDRMLEDSARPTAQDQVTEEDVSPESAPAEPRRGVS